MNASLAHAISPAPAAMALDTTALLDWYITTFVPAPERGFTQMNPERAGAKYITKRQPLTAVLVRRAIQDAVRYLPINGQWEKVPLSYGAHLATANDWARSLAIDVDSGGRAAVAAVLQVCADHQLVAFAQLSTSDQHDGGHVYVLAATWQPASLLSSLARQIQTIAGVAGEVFPGKTPLRLPLMQHLRAPGGPRRFPILLQSGELIDPTSPWSALQQLREQHLANTTEALIQAMQTLPQVAVETPQRLHKSKVNPRSDTSVIGWYNQNYPLDDVLAQVGMIGRGRLVRCPFHDDQHPSLAIWPHRDGKMVCHCFSAQSNCPVAATPCMDAFDLACLIAQRSPQAMVADLCHRHNLGHRRTTEIVTLQAPPDPERAWPAHQKALATAREQLAARLETAAQARGKVTAIRGTPGIGKTTYGSQIANAAFRTGKRVAIVVGSHAIATTEWVPLLDQPMIWQPRTALCDEGCCTHEQLETLPLLGYALPRCRPGCRYAAQKDQREGHIVIYQYHHLHFDGGALLADADLIIVDESPLHALVPEQRATRAELQELLRHLDGQRVPAAPLVRTLISMMRQGTTLSGAEIMRALEAAFGTQLPSLLAQAAESKAAQRHPAPNRAAKLEHLPRLFLGDLLAALIHDREHPNALLAMENGAYVWHEKRPFLSAAYGVDTPPAVVVLDGSADPLVSTALYQPWPVSVETIDAPVSPYVTLVQCPITAATRQIVQEPKRLEAVSRAIAAVCNQLGIVLAGGVTYKGAVSTLEQALGAAGSTMVISGVRTTWRKRRISPVR